MQTKRESIIEDDADAADVLKAYLERDKFEVVIAGDGQEGLDILHKWKPHLILLDVMLPGMNGTEVLSALRRTSDIPVIMVTAMGDTADRIGALRYGADDYVVKPYNPSEVVARVHAVLRRAHPHNLHNMQTDILLRWQGLEVNPESRCAKVTDNEGDQRVIEFTPTEFSLLILMMRAPTRPFTRQYLLESCLPESDALERVVDTHVYNIRKKLESVGIYGVMINVRSIGYRFRQP